MTEKKPLTEGQTRGVEKGHDKPNQGTTLKPKEPPPAPKPSNEHNDGKDN